MNCQLLTILSSNQDCSPVFEYSTNCSKKYIYILYIFNVPWFLNVAHLININNKSPELVLNAFFLY